ncbi:MAG: MFS transporter [Candidatus Carbobacillus altaicus]|nr:MFS transporter [Candidatus Carbobacillus altaicus]
MVQGMQRLWGQWTGYNRDIKLILLTQLLFSIGMGMFMIVYNLYVRALGYEQLVVGRVVSSMAFGTALALIPAGLLSDRLSRKKLVLFGGMMTVITLFLRSVIEGVDGLVSTAFVEGMFAALIQVSFVPLLSEYSREEERVNLFSLLFALNMGANIFGNLGGGLISDFFRRVFGISTVLSLRWTLFVSIAIIMLAIVPMMMLNEKKRHVENEGVPLNIKGTSGEQVTSGEHMPPVEKTTSGGQGTSVEKTTSGEQIISSSRVIRSDQVLLGDQMNKQKNIVSRWGRFFDYIQANRASLRLIVLFSIAQLFIGFGAGLVIPYLNLYFADRFQASPSMIGFIVSLGQAATAAAMLLGPFVVRRLGEVRAIVVLQLASIPFLLLTGFTQELFLAALGYLFRQALMNAGTPIQMSMMMNGVNERFRGLANSMSAVNFNLGWALMGPVSMQIVQAKGAYWGYATVFMLTAALYLLGSFYFYIIFRKPNDRPAHFDQVKHVEEKYES